MMSEHNKHNLVEAVIQQIQIEVMERRFNMEAIDGLLQHLPEKVLEAYLPEEEFRDQRVINALEKAIGVRPPNSPIT